MSDIKNGGAAFPSGESYSVNGVINQRGPLNQGMTLRDYFATQALAGLLAAGDHDNFTANAIAKDSYVLADAMLEARGEK